MPHDRAAVYAGEAMRRVLGNVSMYFRWDVYRRLLPYVWPYKVPMAIVLVFSLACTGISLVEPWGMKILIDNALGAKPLPDWLRQTFFFLPLTSAYALALFAVLGALALGLIRNVLEIISDYLKSRINNGINTRFAADIFNHFLRLSFRYHDRTTVGDSIYLVSNDTSFVSTLIWSNFRHLLTALVSFAGMLWIVIQLDWLLAVLALAVGPVQYLSLIVYNKLFKERSKRIRVMQSKVHSIMQEVLTGLRVVKAFGKEADEQERLENHWWGALYARLRLDLHQGLFSFGVRFFSKLDRSLILLIGSFHVIQGRLSVGELLVILTYVGQIQEPLELIGDVFYNMQNSLISAERVFEVIDVELDIQDRPGAQEIRRVRGAITFRDVEFAYQEGQPVLQQINLAVRPGEVVALVGPTGAGKTTVSSLVARFYDPASGAVTLDGQDLRDLTVRTLRDNIALVLQEPLLFTGTLRDNIAYARPDADIAEVEAAARAANAHDFISALPDGYDTPVGERGVTLSGGERQRLCIARAFLKDAPVLILDEPTSSVDSRTEAVILEALDRLTVGRTTFIIAHRLSTVRRADQILVLDKGRIVERGRHDELLRHKGLYAELVGLQAGTQPPHAAGVNGVAAARGSDTEGDASPERQALTTP
jgi:ABC-type multidrug transport system fused ATPase/permease subunit